MSDPTSQAFPAGPTILQGRLIPALKGCPNCRTTQMIAAPELGLCPDCGAEMKVLNASEI
jgi:ssDNA-binding Zn-finger/Zn-ribbon topoisomerase 1